MGNEGERERRGEIKRKKKRKGDRNPGKHHKISSTAAPSFSEIVNQVLKSEVGFTIKKTTTK